jgi:hypothetical protein
MSSTWKRAWARSGLSVRVDADDGVAGAEQKPSDARGNARVVGRMIGLQPHHWPEGRWCWKRVTTVHFAAISGSAAGDLAHRRCLRA